MKQFLSKKCGSASLVLAVTMCAIMSVISLSAVKLSSGIFSSLSVGRMAAQSQQYGEAEAEAIRCTAFENLNIKERETIVGSNFQKQVSMSPATTSNNVKYRNVKIDIFNGSETMPRFSLVVPRSSIDSFSIMPKGTICIWHSTAQTIPQGWHLCDGTNGTPDLRSRFIYGAGGDTNTKASLGIGENKLNGHWSVGYKAGAETFSLVVNQLPPHNHWFDVMTSTNGSHDHGGFVKIPRIFNILTTSSIENSGEGYGVKKGYTHGQTHHVHDGKMLFGSNYEYKSISFPVMTDGNHSHRVSGHTANAGTGTPINNLPPFITLCYIMKL
jgi:microcystin-dependent protein